MTWKQPERSNMSVIIVARLVPAEGCGPNVLSVLKETIPRTQSEDGGCELYALHTAENGDFVFIEKWADDDAFQGHLGSPGTADLGARLENLLAGPIQAEALTPLAVGDTRGAL
jgi:quinol monooxygenase YgiN